MTDKTIFRGDSYDFNPRYLYRIELVNDQLAPFDMAGCTIRTTYKPGPTDPAKDPNDTWAPIKHDITFSAAGAILSSSGLRLESTAAAGVLIEDLPRAESLTLPLGVPLNSDVQVTTADGKDITILAIGILTAADGYTNRSTP